MANMDSTLGALLCGLIFAVYLTATHNSATTSCIQRSIDSTATKLGVVFAAVISTTHTAIVCYTAYRYLVTHFGDTDYVGTAEWSMVGHFAIFTAITLVVQLFYARKVSTFYTGKRRVFLTGAIVVLALAQTAFGILSAWSTTRLPFSADIFEVQIREALGWQMLSNMVCAVLCDLLIFGAMWMEHRSPRFTVKAEGAVEVITRLLVETNLLTTLVAILSLAFYLAYHATAISTLYLIGMLASLNRRDISRPTLAPGHKHTRVESSLSDLFKGTPMSKLRSDVTVSKIGTPTPINDLFTSSANSPGWLRRTFSHEPAPPTAPNSSLRPPGGSRASQWHSHLHPLDPEDPNTKPSVEILSISDYGTYVPDNVEGHSSGIEIAQSPRRSVGFAQQQREEGHSAGRRVEYAFI